MSAQKRPQTARTVESQEIKPATASDLTSESSSYWRAWLDLPERGWLTDGGVETLDWVVA